MFYEIFTYSNSTTSVTFSACHTCLLVAVTGTFCVFSTNAKLAVPGPVRAGCLLIQEFSENYSYEFRMQHAFVLDHAQLFAEVIICIKHFTYM